MDVEGIVVQLFRPAVHVIELQGWVAIGMHHAYGWLEKVLRAGGSVGFVMAGWNGLWRLQPFAQVALEELAVIGGREYQAHRPCRYNDRSGGLLACGPCGLREESREGSQEEQINKCRCDERMLAGVHCYGLIF